MIITESLLHKIKDSFVSHELLGIPITGDFEQFIQSSPEYASPVKVERNFYHYEELQIERYEKIIFSIHIPAANDYSLEEAVAVMGEGNMITHGQRTFLEYRTDDILAVFTFDQESRKLLKIIVVTTMFMD